MSYTLQLRQRIGRFRQIIQPELEKRSFFEDLRGFFDQFFGAGAGKGYTNLADSRAEQVGGYGDLS